MVMAAIKVHHKVHKIVRQERWFPSAKVLENQICNVFTFNAIAHLPEPFCKLVHCNVAIAIIINKGEKGAQEIFFDSLLIVGRRCQRHESAAFIKIKLTSAIMVDIIDEVL